MTTTEYWSAHYKLRRDLGPASEYECVCGKQARDWAYVGPVGGHSDDLSDYVPLCRSCHNSHDAPMFCKYGHEFTIENTYVRPSGHRRCRACGRRRTAESKRRRLTKETP